MVHCVDGSVIMVFRSMREWLENQDSNPVGIALFFVLVWFLFFLKRLVKGKWVSLDVRMVPASRWQWRSLARMSTDLSCAHSRFDSSHGNKHAPRVTEFLFPTAESDQKYFACQLGSHFKQISVMRFWSHMALELVPSSAVTACCNCSGAVCWK